MLDDHPEFPITFFIQFRLKGRLDYAAVMESVHAAARLHPLLCCRVERRGGRYWWVWSPEAVAEIDLNPEVWKTTQPWARQINLSVQTGVRAWGEITETHTEITLQFHHACCDGIGASQFLEDFAVCYSRRTGATDQQPEARQLNPAMLRTRHLAAPRRVGRLPGSWLTRCGIVVRDTLKFLFHSKEELQPHRADVPSDERDGFNLLTDDLDRATTRKLRAVATHRNVTLNDLMVRDLMLTIADWNQKSGSSAIGRRICVLIPNSLRGPSDDQLPAANVIGYCFLSRTWQEVGDPEQLLQSLNEETNRVLRDQHGWLFVQGLQLVQKIPFLMSVSAMLLRRRCMATSLLSHMGNRLNSISARMPSEGDVIQVGDATLEEVRCVPALRCGTNAAVATFLWNGRLMVNLRCAPASFGVSQSREFLAMLMARLERSAAEG